jgi:hypothetical protein
MLISLQEAAGFMSIYHGVFDELWRRRDEPLSEADLLAVISAAQPSATAGYLLVQLKKLRFVVEADAQAGSWELAAPFARWIEYLQQMSRPVSSELVHGRLSELEHLVVSFRAAQARADWATGQDILRDVRGGFQRLGEDLGQTRAAIANIVSEAKAEHRKQGALERFRRINRLWNEYLLPMLELLDPAGQLEVVCIAWENQLALSMERSFLPDRRLAERIESEMQVLRVAVRQSFRECRSELEPLHERLRRDSLWAEGAARLLATVERVGAVGSDLAGCLPLSSFRFAGQMSRAALVASAARWLDISEPPAAIDFVGAPTAADTQAVEDILAAIEVLPAGRFPVDDLLAWLADDYGHRGFHAVLQVFSLLVTDSRYQASFQQPIGEYNLAGGLVRCGRVKLALRRAA